MFFNIDISCAWIFSGY